MNGWLLALGLFAQWGPLSGTSALQGVASLSPKPSSCPKGEKLDDLWNRARSPRVERYCTALGKGYSLLGARQPNAALAQAGLASELIAEQAAPLILSARAYVALGQFAASWEQFSKAEKLEGFRIDAVEALHDYAKSALANGHWDAARRSYRRLVTQTGLFAESRRALQVYIEAAAVVMQEGPSSLPEVIAYLEEAQRRNDSTLYPCTLRALLVLARERNGEAERAKPLLDELDDVGLEQELSKNSRLSAPLLLAVDHEALLALSMRSVDPIGAREKWASVLATSEAQGSPWVSEIRSRFGSH